MWVSATPFCFSQEVEVCTHHVSSGSTVYHQYVAKAKNQHGYSKHGIIMYLIECLTWTMKPTLTWVPTLHDYIMLEV